MSLRTKSMRDLRPRKFVPGRVALYAFLMTAAAAFLLPLYIMLVTSLKPLDEIRVGNIFALPSAPTLEAWSAAWSTVCTGVSCEGVRGGFANSLLIALPAPSSPSCSERLTAMRSPSGVRAVRIFCSRF